MERVRYENYLRSPEWARKRKARLAIDKHQCRLCGEDGSNYGLEVHHKPESYKLMPFESIEDDLTTLCRRCHETVTSNIRKDRYARRELQTEPISLKVVSRKDTQHGLANFEFQIDFLRPVDNAQRANSRPHQQVGKVAETDFIEAGKNRRRL